MARILKIYTATDDVSAISKSAKIIQAYDAFLLVEVSSAQAKSLSRKYPVEDITAQYRLRIGGRIVNTGKQRITAEDPSHPRSRGKLRPGPHHYIVQFVGPIMEGWLRRVRAAGATLREPIGSFSYVVRAGKSEVPKIASLGCVRWMGHLPHSDRVHPLVIGAGSKPKHSHPRLRPGVYTVEIFAAEDARRIARAARRLGFEVRSRDANAHLLIVSSAASEKQRQQQVKALAIEHGVRFIRQRTIPRMANNVATKIMGTAFAATEPKGLRLTGEGEIIAVCDGGLDTGDPDNIHPDFAGRVIAIKSYPISPDYNKEITNPNGNDGASDTVSGHGTHVTGSILGNGTASAGSSHLIRGLAYKAKLVFQAVQQEMKWKKTASSANKEQYLFSGIPSNLAPFFRFAYNKGARIHSDSWADGELASYDDKCRQFDLFVWEHKDFCFVICAGNYGTEKDGRGKINLGSVSPPGTAKNCITVGACESKRPEFNSKGYGTWFSAKFRARPFYHDPLANDPNQVVPFSGRGPTRDGRMKPDVVAPGTFILSTRSTQLPPDVFGWMKYHRNEKYCYDGGTSMATPLTAGGVALIREFLRKKKKFASPSAALLKATLIAGAKRLPKTAPPGTIVDPHQGFGRVNLDRSLKRPLCMLEGPALKTGKKSTTVIEVPSGRRGLRVAMCYSDYPGESLINNLSVIVTDPAGKRYVGNQKSTSRSSLSLDAGNNVEVVDVPKAKAGTWTIDVVASDVPKGPQDFALVAALV